MNGTDGVRIANALDRHHARGLARDAGDRLGEREARPRRVQVRRALRDAVDDDAGEADRHAVDLAERLDERAERAEDRGGRRGPQREDQQRRLP